MVSLTWTVVVDVADRELNVEREVLLDVELESFLLVAAEAGLFDAHFVAAGKQEGKDEAAFGIGGHFTRDAGGIGDQGDFGLGDGGATLVADDALEGGLSGLGVNGGSQGQGERQTDRELRHGNSFVSGEGPFGEREGIPRSSS